MDKNRALQMIDEYLTEPNSIASEWIECLIFCRKYIMKTELGKAEMREIIKLITGCHEFEAEYCAEVLFEKGKQND